MLHVSRAKLPSGKENINLSLSLGEHYGGSERDIPYFSLNMALNLTRISL